MTAHVLPTELEARLMRFAVEPEKSPDEVLSAVSADFHDEHEADQAAGKIAQQRWNDYQAGKEETYTLAELMGASDLSLMRNDFCRRTIPGYLGSS